jgi:hypothetical protein
MGIAGGVNGQSWRRLSDALLKDRKKKNAENRDMAWQAKRESKHESLLRQDSRKFLRA